MEIDPSFAEVLMSTFYAGGNMSEEDYKKCKRIWEENNNDRSKVLQIVASLCGNVNTPQARYIRALAWSFNRVEFSEQRIKSINEYLSHELYKKAYQNLAVSSEKGIKYGEKLHRMIMLQYLAEAYCHLKMYDKEEEVYLKMYNLKTIKPNACVKLAKYYSKRGQKERAIELLRKEKKTIIYILNNEYREAINKYLNELEKKKQGINKHIFQGYDTYPGPFLGPIDKPVYSPKLEREIKELREKYKNVFETHRELLEQIDFHENELKNNPENESYKEEYNKLCVLDINLYPQILNYYNEFNKLGFDYKFIYEDNKNPNYPIFKKLIVFYEKEKRIEEAIKVCNLAIECGIIKYLGSVSMNDKKEKLKAKLK